MIICSSQNHVLLPPIFHHKIRSSNPATVFISMGGTDNNTNAFIAKIIPLARPHYYQKYNQSIIPGCDYT